MKLYTIEANGNEYVAVLVNDKMIKLESLGIKVKNMNDLIQHFEELKDKLINSVEKIEMNHKLGKSENFSEADSKENDSEINYLEAKDYKVLAPIPVPLQDVICLGVNYRSHIEETVDVLDFTKKADTVYFSKRVNRCNTPDGIIPNYDMVDSLDYEVELGVILKKDAFRVSVEEAADYIFGYTIINDVSARNLQLKHQQWYFGKSLDGYTPMGPCIVTADQIGDVHKLDISCYVNDEKRQSSNTEYMITTVEEAISELSRGITLKAGTIIATGTPGGVAMGMKPPVFLKTGDIVRCQISGIGEIINTVG
ncbi:MAG: fumarylacetoacetate hydrolase family protein [Eubacterium sp.]|nr:fumarylacetoacetate hydrolase family protein [Eubacterium sp.]